MSPLDCSYWISLNSPDSYLTFNRVRNSSNVRFFSREVISFQGDMISFQRRKLSAREDRFKKAQDFYLFSPFRVSKAVFFCKGSL